MKPSGSTRLRHRLWREGRLAAALRSRFTGWVRWHTDRVPAARLSVLVLFALGILALGKGALVLDAVGEVGDAEIRSVETPPPVAAGLDDELLAEPAAGPEVEAAVSPGQTGAASPAAPEAHGEAGRRTFTSSELEVLGELAERRLALDERERDLDLRAALLDDAEAKLVARLAELESLRAKVAAMVEELDQAEEAKLTRLVKIYESMKPKAAAEIFDRLEMSVLVEVVSRMREGVSSEVIGRMNPERAEQLTGELARRRSLPRLDLPAGDGSTG